MIHFLGHLLEKQMCVCSFMLSINTDPLLWCFPDSGFCNSWIQQLEYVISNVQTNVIHVYLNKVCIEHDLT